MSHIVDTVRDSFNLRPHYRIKLPIHFLLFKGVRDVGFARRLTSRGLRRIFDAPECNGSTPSLECHKMNLIVMKCRWNTYREGQAPHSIFIFSPLFL